MGFLHELYESGVAVRLCGLYALGGGVHCVTVACIFLGSTCGQLNTASVSVQMVERITNDMRL